MADQERFHIQSDSPAAADMLFWRIAGHEALSRPSAYELWVLSTNPSLDAQDILGRAFDVTYDFSNADGGTHQRHFQGHAVRFKRGGQTGRYFEYRIQLRSWFWLLTKRTNSRVLQDKTVTEILDAVFQDSPIERFTHTTTAGVIGSHPARRYCVQYAESDYAYLSRLLEDEGIYYWFDAHDQPGAMHLSDASSVAQKKLPASATLEFVSTDSIDANQAQVTRWSTTRHFDTGKHAGRDRNFKTIRTQIGSEINVADTHELADFEEFEFPGGYFDHERADDVVKLRGDELASRRARDWGLSSWPDIAAGMSFSLTGSPDASSDGDYLIGACTFFLSHSGHEGFTRRESPEELLPVWDELLEGDPIDPGAASAIEAWIGSHPGFEDDLRGASAFAFTALPADLNYRPPRLTPRRRMPGPQSAIVVGPQEVELHVDEFGRVKVQFHWDRYGKNDAQSSCWVRVSQPWSGQAWGGYFMPRIGQEVIVDFLDGDPDRPLVVGRVYNDDEPIPYPSPTQSGFKSRSTPGGSPSNYNEIMFEDKKGEENLNIQAEKNMSRSVKNDDSASVGNNQTASVGNDQNSSVGNNQTASVGNDQTSSVGNNQTASVGNDQTASVGNNQTLSVGNDQTSSVGNNQTASVGVNRTTSVGADDALTVTGKRDMNVTGKLTETVVGGQEVNVSAGYKETVTGGSTSDITGGATNTVIGGLINNVTGIMAHNVTGMMIQNVIGPLTVGASGPVSHSTPSTMNVFSDGVGTYGSSAQLKLGVGGASIDVTDAEIKISAGGATVTINGSGVSLNGSKISLN